MSSTPIARLPGSPDSSALHLDRQLCFALYSASLAMTKVYKPLLARLSLTYPQYLVMLALWEQDARTVSELGRQLFLDSGTLTPLLKRLERLGYVDRQRDADDERRVIVSLTETGGALRVPAREIYEEVGCATNCSLQALTTMTRELTTLRDSLSSTSP